MKKCTGAMALLILLVLLGHQTVSADYHTKLIAEPLPSESTTVKGEVLMITGVFHLRRDDQGREVLDAKDEIYVVREETGYQVPVIVDEKTKIDLDQRVSTGDEIEATLSPDGHAVLIKPAS